MNVADRIQLLRKSKGISQEELADRIGVSRQSVSKWESEQSLPDAEKIVLLSDFFDVTTDYILKGIEPVADEPAKKKEKPNAGVFSIAGTAFNCMGIVVSAMVWHEEQVAAATAIGFIFLIMGCMIYAVGMTVGEKATADKARRLFWPVNIWVVPFLPFSVGYNFVWGGGGLAPYPVLEGSPLVTYVLFWVVYLAMGTLGSLLLLRKRKKQG